MSRIHEFAIDKGKLSLEKSKEQENLSSVHEKLWNLLVDFNLKKEEWVLAFNIVGPYLALLIFEVDPVQAQKIIEGYSATIGPKAEEADYFQALKDPVSKLTHILRERFELMLRIAKDTESRELGLQMSGLDEIQSFLNKVPRYLVSAVYESLSLYRQSGEKKDV